MAQAPSYYKKVSGINVANAGANYTTANVTFSGGGGTGAAATAIIVDGHITGFTITSGGYNYTTPPTVTITGDGAGAEATASLEVIDGAYSGFKESLNHLISNQLPEFVQNEFPQFVLFLKKYYEFLDEQDQANNVLLNADSFNDINRTLDTFLPSFKNQYLKYFPTDTSIDDRRLVKFIRQFYEAKGSEKAIELLFRMFYAENIEIIYPAEQILRASDGIWLQDKIIRVTTDSTVSGDPFFLIGKIVRIVSYKTVGSVTFQEFHDATITDAFNVAYSNPPVYELTIQRDTTDVILIPGAGATATAALDGDAVDTITLGLPGSGYYAAPTVSIVSASGEGATARAVLDGNGGISEIVVTDGGSGYLTAPAVTLETDSIRTHIHLLSDAELTNPPKYGYLIRILNSVEIGTGTPGDGSDYGFKVNEIYQIDESGSTGAYVEAGYFAGDYVAIGVDNRASIRILAVDTNNLPTQIEIFYSGYAFERGTFETTITSLNGGTVDLTFTTGSEYTKQGRFKNSRGMLSNVNKLQDNYYYQAYSYVIRSGVPSNKWMNMIKNTTHPAGMQVFGELILTQTVDYSADIGIVEDKLQLYEFFTDSVTISDAGLSAYVVTFFKAVSDTLSTPTDSKAISFNKVVTDSISAPSDAKVVSVGKNVSDSVTSSEAFSSITFTKVLSDSVTITDEVLIGQLREFGDSVTTPTDSAAVTFGKTLTDSTGTSTDAVNSIDFGKNVSDSITAPTDAINNFQFTKVVTDSTSPVTEAAVVTFGKVLSDSITAPTEVAVVDYSKPVSDSITSPTEVAVVDFGKTVSDSLTTPTEAAVVNFGKNVSDSITAPTEAAVVNFGKTLSDSLSTPTDAGNINIQNYWAYDYTSGDTAGDYVGTDYAF